MKKKILNILIIFVIGMAGGIFADQILWPYFVERPLFYQYDLEQPPVYVTERKEVIIQENEALTQAIEKVAKTVVGVRTVTGAGVVLEGSGLILTSDGLMVTLASLVPRGETFSFDWEDQPLSYQVLKRDFAHDLALVKLAQGDLPTTGFGEAEIKLGERVFLVGVVFSGKKPTKTINEGIVKGVGQESIMTNIFETRFLAGSPLFDIEGRVLGLNTIDQQGRVIAIPIDIVRSFAGL